MRYKNFNKFLLPILTLLVVILFSIFCFSVFKNIQYPLLWNDEAETAMHTTRVLQYGFPKVYDGKNVVNSFYPPYFKLAVNEKLDAYLYLGWFPLYFFSIPILIASQVSDIYIKTAILRCFSAIIGITGLIILLRSIIEVFGKSQINKLLFPILFLFFEIFSVTLILHLREFRYYSWTIFFTSCFFYIYFKYKVFHKINFSKYCVLSTILLLLIFNTFFPLFFILVSSLFLYEIGYLIIERISKKNNKQDRKELLITTVKKRFQFFIPYIIWTVFVLPFIFFFNIFKTTSKSLMLFHFEMVVYKHNLIHIISYLGKYEYFYIAVLIKWLLFLIYWNNKYFLKKLEIYKKIQTSNILSIFVIVYILIISRNPIFVFSRYFLVLQPVLIIIILLDLFIIWSYLSLFKKQSVIKPFFIASFTCIIILSQISNLFLYQGRIYELFHPYKGPLDYIIPYISNNFQDPKNLIIATNYEETSYMYYLGSKVIVGYVGNNLAEDMKFQPDIISFRPIPGYVDPKVFINFLKKEKYVEISFPVYNNPVNNIPELSGSINHLFATKMATSEKEKLSIFVRETLLNNKVN